MKKPVKGNYGYLKEKRTFVFWRTVLYFAISLALLFAGILTTGSRRNMLTVVAVLGCLPAAKSLVNFIIYCRAKGCTDQVKDDVAKASDGLIGMYDMYFTSYKKNFAISHMVVEGKNICGLTEDDKCDTALCESHLTDQLKQAGHTGLTIKIFTDAGKYCNRLKEIAKIDREKTPEKDDEIRVVLYDISL